MPYLTLAARYRDQPSTEIFAHFGYAGEHGETWEAPYERLVTLAKPEDWDFHRSEFKRSGQHFPILVGYLNHTFLRIQEQDKIVYSDNDDRACFNTGLQTPNEKDIFATFFRNMNAQERDQADWNLYGFFDSYSERLTEFRPLPAIATYIENASDLVLDTSCEIEVNYDHLFDDIRERLPDVLKDNQTLSIAAIQGSLEFLKEKIIRNYKLAIPHWYRGHTQRAWVKRCVNDSGGDLLPLRDG